MSAERRRVVVTGMGVCSAAGGDLQTFWDRHEQPNVHLFHYAELEADLAGQQRRLAKVLDIDVPAVVIGASTAVIASRASALRIRRACMPGV